VGGWVGGKTFVGSDFVYPLYTMFTEVDGVAGMANLQTETG
jgi:hypothetical protein